MAKILLIDDEDSFRNSLKMILERKGFEILEADNGKTGVELVKQNADLDILIMDVVMPNKGGVEALMELNLKSRKVKAILMTGKVKQGYEAFDRLISVFGVKKILFKPFKKDELLNAINELLEN